MDGLCKFDQLRIKTDKDLIQFLARELDQGLSAALEGLTSSDDCASVKECHARANRAYAKASRLSRVVYDLSQTERIGVQSRLERLRGMLDGLVVRASGRTPSEREVAALARALWQARGCPEGSAERDWFRAERALKSCEQLADCVRTR
jgi:hypothetical protein